MITLGLKIRERFIARSSSSRSGRRHARVSGNGLRGKALRGKGPRHKALLDSGFTLIELMIVITIIFILLGLAAGRYDRSVVRAREASLRQDLQVMRQAIDNYTLDKQAAPESIDALQQAGYLRSIPLDPMTQAKDWQPQFDEVVLSPDQSNTGIVDVHSNSDKVSPFDGTPYKEW